jgi:hypothetical protein
MTTSLHKVVTVHPEQMTGRAQMYLTIAGIRHLAIGLCCLLVPWAFHTSSWRPLRALVPGGLLTWGIAGCLTGLICLSAAGAKKEGWARAGLLSSAVITGLWAGALWSAVALGEASSPTGPIIWTAVVLKDLVVCRQPMRSPFEPIVREAIARRRSRET